MTSTERFPIRFTGANRAMRFLGIRPTRCFVEVDADAVVVAMAWAFRASVPRSSVRDAAPDDRRVMGWGVHGWRGSWLVNGSSTGIVRIDVDPPARGRLLGARVRVQELRVAVDDPEGLVRTLVGR